MIAKEDNEDFENSTKCWIYDNDYIDRDVKVRVYCHITGKYKVFTHRHCNVNLRLNHKITTLFYSLKNYDSYFIMQELVKFNIFH